MYLDWLEQNRWSRLLYIKTTIWIFMKILQEMYLWTRKSSLYFGSHLGLDLGILEEKLQLIAGVNSYTTAKQMHTAWLWQTKFVLERNGTKQRCTMCNMLPHIWHFMAGNFLKTEFHGSTEQTHCDSFWLRILLIFLWLLQHHHQKCWMSRSVPPPAWSLLLLSIFHWQCSYLS